jgi:hypothetical protein
MKKAEDLTGQEFGLLTAVKRVESAYGNARWVCDCKCGSSKTVFAHQLKANRATSCGCEWKKGLSKRFWKGCGELSGSMFCKMKSNAAVRDIPFKITIEYAWKLYDKQRGRCAITGTPLVLSRTWASDQAKGTIRTTASLDRIDNSHGYVEGNVQWIHKLVQKWKGATNNEDFIREFKELSRAMVEYHGLIINKYG